MGCAVSRQTLDNVTSRACKVKQTDLQQLPRREAFEEVGAAIGNEYSEEDAGGHVIKACPC